MWLVSRKSGRTKGLASSVYPLRPKTINRYSLSSSAMTQLYIYFIHVATILMIMHACARINLRGQYSLVSMLSYGPQLIKPQKLTTCCLNMNTSITCNEFPGSSLTPISAIIGRVSYPAAKKTINNVLRKILSHEQH